MSKMNKLVLGVSFHSIKIQFAKRIRVEVHSITLSLQVHIKITPNCQYYFVLQKTLPNCWNEWGFLSTQVPWDHKALLLSSFWLEGNKVLQTRCSSLAVV